MIIITVLFTFAVVQMFLIHIYRFAFQKIVEDENYILCNFMFNASKYETFTKLKVGQLFSQINIKLEVFLKISLLWNLYSVLIFLYIDHTSSVLDWFNINGPEPWIPTYRSYWHITFNAYWKPELRYHVNGSHVLSYGLSTSGYCLSWSWIACSDKNEQNLPNHCKSLMFFVHGN